MAFQLPVDIANCAAQHCGQPLIDRTLGFAEQSGAARQISSRYDGLRRAELQRNVWRFATRKAVLRPIDDDTMLLVPGLWVSSTTYFVGSIVTDETNYAWVSNIPDNLNNNPTSGTGWEPYFGPLTVALYDSETFYQAGELVYTADGDGTNRVFLSLQSANDDDPSEATDWDEDTTYRKDQVVTHSSVAYMSLIDLNIDQTPSDAPALWSSVTTYSIGQQVGASDGIIYTSAANGNLNHDPTTDGGTHWTNTGVLNPWTTVFTGGTGSLKWLQIGGEEFPNGVGLATMNIIYPLGAGPSTQSSTRNVYRLPSGYLRRAPQDPKAGSTSPWGAPSGAWYDDWEFEGNYLVSATSDLIVFRFVADVQDVTKMTDEFCEGLGARVALAVCEKLTQSSDKLKTIAGIYDKFMREARLGNAIEIGTEEPAEDDWVTCRQ